MKFKKINEEFNDLDILEARKLKEELHNMSVEDIMADSGLSRAVATAIYDAEHDDAETMTREEFFRMLDSI